MHSLLGPRPAASAPFSGQEAPARSRTVASAQQVRKVVADECPGGPGARAHRHEVSLPDSAVLLFRAGRTDLAALPMELALSGDAISD
jgi:hypothetical protein